jgi:hypothetical protein
MTKRQDNLPFSFCNYWLAQFNYAQARCLAMHSLLHSGYEKKNMKRLLLIPSLVMSCFSLAAHADIYKCVGDSGIPAFIDAKTKAGSNYKNCVLFIRDDSSRSSPATRSEQKRTRTATPADFPRVDNKTQSQRDDKRKEILQQELEAERQALEDARKAKAEGESNPEVYHKKGADGKTQTFRNMPKFEEKIQGLQSDVDAHEQNVELLQKELNSLK